MNGIEDAIRWIELNGIQHWKVSKSRGDKNDKAFETSDEDQLSARILQFRETMKLYPGNYFYITGKKNKTQTTGLYEYEFINGATVAGSGVGSTPQQPQVMGISDADVQKRIDEALEKAEVKRKLAELEKENKELKAENQTAATSIGKAITEYLPMVMGIIGGKKIPQTVSLGTIQQQQPQAVEFEPIAENENQEVDEELTSRVQNAIVMWAGADPDFIDTLEFIADFAANDGEVMGMKYAGIKNFLKK